MHACFTSTPKPSHIGWKLHSQSKIVKTIMKTCRAYTSNFEKSQLHFRHSVIKMQIGTAGSYEGWKLLHLTANEVEIVPDWWCNLKVFISVRTKQLCLAFSSMTNDYDMRGTGILLTWCCRRRKWRDRCDSYANKLQRPLRWWRNLASGSASKQQDHVQEADSSSHAGQYQAGLVERLWSRHF
jgi:hypothetical protein